MRRSSPLYRVAIAGAVLVVVLAGILLALGVAAIVGLKDDDDRSFFGARQGAVSSERATTTRWQGPPVTTAGTTPAVRDPRYRFVGEPLVLFRPPGPGRPSARYRVMVRVRPKLPHRWASEGPQRSSMLLDEIPNGVFGGLPRVGDECYLDSYDADGVGLGPDAPVSEAFSRPREGMRVTLRIEYREKPGQRKRAFSTHATIRRATSNREWDAFQRLGLERLGCAPWP